MASASTVGMKRPASIARPRVVLYQVVSAARPENPDPLLLVTEPKA